MHTSEDAARPSATAKRNVSEFEESGRPVRSRRLASTDTLGGYRWHRERPAHAADVLPRPGASSRPLFSDEQGERDGGGWTLDWLVWSPGQSVEGRGAVTLRALVTLGSHGDRLPNRD
jgi:hypothetical protein